MLRNSNFKGFEYVLDRLFNIFGQYTVRAIVRCSEYDTFNEEFGMRLVEAKIRKKIHDKAVKKLYKNIELCESLVNEMYNEQRKHDLKYQLIELDIKNNFS